MQTVLLRQLAYDNANLDCQNIIKHWKEKGNLMDYLRLCGNVGSIQHKDRIAALEAPAVINNRNLNVLILQSQDIWKGNVVIPSLKKKKQQCLTPPTTSPTTSASVWQEAKGGENANFSNQAYALDARKAIIVLSIATLNLIRMEISCLLLIWLLEPTYPCHSNILC